MLFILISKYPLKIGDRYFEPFIEASEIQFAIQQLAEQIYADYSDQCPVFVGVLNGSILFLADLLKHYKGDCELSFIKVKSYEGTNSTNHITESLAFDDSLQGRSIILVEDIVDTGNTIVYLKEAAKKKNIHHVKIATLFLKPEVYQKAVKLDYVGIRIPNKFIVGCGLDYDGLGRNSSEVFVLKE